MTPDITLNNGVTIPQLGFGVFKIDPTVTRDMVLAAFDIGYRHVDTAQMYGNERGVGEAVRESGLPRSEVFITSKLNNGYHEPEVALRAFDRTMDILGLDVLDLFLIHWPLPAVGDFTTTWAAMEAMYASGRVRAIGVSNFHERHLQLVLGSCVVVPAWGSWAANWVRAARWLSKAFSPARKVSAFSPTRCCSAASSASMAATRARST